MKIISIFVFVISLAIGCSTTSAKKYEKSVAKITSKAAEICDDYGILVEAQAAIVVEIDQDAAPIEDQIVKAANKACAAVRLFHEMDQGLAGR